MESVRTGVLYVVATPIGNLADMTHRAVQILSSVHRIAAEDTRHSRHLLEHYNIRTPTTSYHEHNEEKAAADLLTHLINGEDIALISDAGTPMISDPGFTLTQKARAAGIKVVPIPGPSAVIAALSASGLPVDRFFFEGFLPAKSSARRSRLEALCNYPHTLAFYESPHRIAATLADAAAVLGGQRSGVIARELTKIHETIRGDTLENLCLWQSQDSHQSKGEFVLLISGNPEPVTLSEEEQWIDRLMTALTRELPVKQAVAIAMEVTGRRKNELYRRGLGDKS